MITNTLETTRSKDLVVRTTTTDASQAPGAESMNILLVHPIFPLTYWGFQHGLSFIGKKAALPPLGLITLAALLPSHWHMRLVDLNVEALHDADMEWADIVLTGGMLIQSESIYDVIARAHSFKIPVAVGGPAPTTSPELFVDADIVFRGEAEGRIDELVGFLAKPPEHHCILNAPADFPDIKTGAVPRFDLLDLSKYASMSIQFSRGCPHRCEFCDIIEIFGRRPRTKTPEQVVAELQALYGLSYRGTLFFVDDNYIGSKPAVRRLLPIIQEWQRAHGQPFEFYTEAGVNLAADPQLLRDMVDAGFTSVFVGIETPSAKALEQSKKFQNLRLDLSLAIDRITRAGLEVMGGFIMGFDDDGPDVAQLQREFLAHQPIPIAMLGLLMALPGTALWRRLEEEGRLRARPNGDQFMRPNFVPVMEERALLKGYVALTEWLYSPKAYYSRCEAFLKIAGPHENKRPTTLGEVGVLFRTIWHVGILSPNRRHFWRLMAKAVLRGRIWVRLAVAHAVQGEHFIRYTREYVLPRLAHALTEIQTEIARDRHPYGPDGSEPALTTVIPSLKAAVVYTPRLPVRKTYAPRHRVDQRIASIDLGSGQSAESSERDEGGCR